MDTDLKKEYRTINSLNSLNDLESRFEEEMIPVKIVIENLNKEKTSYQIFLKLLKENILIIVGSIMYFLSLHGCYASQDECVLLIENELYMMMGVLLIVLSAIFNLINLLYIIQKKIRIYTLIIQLTIMIFLCCFYDTETNLKSHGGYNRIILLSFLIIFSFIYLLGKFIIFLFHKNKIVTILICILIPYLIHLGINYHFENSCKNWEKGFKNSQIDNKTQCRIETPKICYESLVDGMFDVSYYLGDTCKSIGNNKKKEILHYNKEINRNVKRTGYPKVEGWNFKTLSLYDNFKRAVVRSIIDMDDPSLSQEEKNEIEVIVEFDKDDIGEMKIEMKKMEEESKNRKEIFDLKGKDLLFKNIFILFIDSVSRKHFERKLPKLWKWIEKFYNPEENSKYEGFQFLKYHGTATWTNGNLMPAFFGVPYDERNGGTYAIKHFKEKGYFLGSFTNQCSREFVDLHGGPMTNALTWERYDHELSAPFCDPNFTPLDNPFPLLNGPYGMRRKCLYNRPTLEYAIDYTTQFMKGYKNQPKFFRLGDINGHEGTGEVVKYDDDILTQFMEKFEKEGFMDDTLTIVMTDHGYTMPGFHTIFKTEDHLKELTLPFLNYILPKNIKNFDLIKNNLKLNENKAITPYDFHSTLIGLLNDKNISSNSLGVNLFKSVVTRDSTCKHFGIKSDWCRCQDEL